MTWNYQWTNTTPPIQAEANLSQTEGNRGKGGEPRWTEENRGERSKTEGKQSNMEQNGTKWNKTAAIQVFLLIFYKKHNIADIQVANTDI
jgi:hypothetical protein